jgi:DNA-directed RNA polymerase specialized sigma24 family protein
MVVTVTYDAFGSVFHSPDDRLSWVHRALSSRLAQFIRGVTWGLISREDVQDAYQETVHAFWNILGSRDVPAEEYLPRLQAIARNKAIDALRRKRHRPGTNNEEILLTLEDPYCYPADRFYYGSPRLAPAEGRELSAVLAEVVAALPPRQRLVARVYLEHCAEFGARDVYEPLTALVQEITGQQENVETIKSLWHAARKAIQAALVRRGYDLDDDSRL